MSLTFSALFISRYYSNTYLPPVDLSEKWASKYLLEKEDREGAQIAQRLISSREVQPILSEPLTYSDFEVEISEKNRILERHGFKLLSIKANPKTRESVPFYNVLEHDELKGKIIKSGAARVVEGGPLAMGPTNDRQEKSFFVPEESLLRIEMANRIRKVAQEEGIDIKVPDKKLVPYIDSIGITEPTRKYCLICEKVDVLDVQETGLAIARMGAEEQTERARAIATLVKKAGIVDANLNNIRLSRQDKKWVIIDTEPAGLLVRKKPGLWNKFFGPRGASVEKCARIGLFQLVKQTSLAVVPGASADADGRNPIDLPIRGFKFFHAELKREYEKAVVPSLSKWKIALAIFSFGTILIIDAIIALVKLHLAEKVHSRLTREDLSFQQRFQQFPDEQNRLVKEYLKKRNPIALRYFAYVDGVLCV